MKQTRLSDKLTKQCNELAEAMDKKGTKMSFAMVVSLIVELGIPLFKRKYLK